MTFEKGNVPVRPFEKGGVPHNYKPDIAPPELVEAVSTPPEIIKSWRFGTPDFKDMGVWLLKRLQVKRPHLTDQILAGWLKGCMESPEYLFLRTKDSVILAQQLRKLMETTVYTQEIFVWSRAQGKSAAWECVALYDELLRWSKSLGAVEILVDRDSDLSRDAVKAKFVELRIHHESYVKL